MSRFTKKQMVEDYERLYDHDGLLELYLYDTQSKIPPVSEAGRQGDDYVQVQLFRATSASGGYVVIRWMHKDREKLNGDWVWSYGTPQIELLDKAIRQYADSGEHTLAVKTCLERLRIARCKLLDEKYTSGSRGAK